MDIVVSEHLLPSLPERLAALGRHDVVIVADPDTRDAIGRDTVKRMAEATRAVTKIIKEPSVTLELAEILSARLRKARFAIAIGSGSINDLVKFAAHRAGIPYAIVATAPSMNGYSSRTASLARDGFKQSFEATAPVAIFADLPTLARAPLPLRAAGVGDTLCRSTVQADWRVAHKLLGVPYDESLFTDIMLWEKELLAHADKVKAGDVGIMRVLFRALIAGGEAMRRHGSSMPASQGEHMIAHTMEYLGHPAPAFHGEEIAVTTMTMARLQFGILAQDHLRLCRLEPENNVWAMFPPGFRELFRRKQLACEEPQILSERWAEIRDWIMQDYISPLDLEPALKKAGCRTHATDIGWEIEEYQNAYKLAYLTRDRFTFLDLGVMNGIL